MKFCSVLSVLTVAAAFIAAASGSDVDIDAKKAIVPLTASDMLRLVSATDRAKALLKDIRRRTSSSRHLDDQDGSSTVDGGGGLRFLAEADTCEDQLDVCRADLGACQAGTDGGDGDGASILYVQMAQTCKIKEKIDGDGNVYYELSSKDMDDETYAFTDRPYRIAETMTTLQFFRDFDATFDEETGGRPNAAMTFRHADTGNFEGPLISVLVEAAYRKENGKYVYELTQSEEQEAVHALKDFFRDGDGEDGVAVYEMCSLFIDGATICDPSEVDNCRDYNCVDQKYATKEGDCEDCMCYNPPNPYDQPVTNTFCESSERTKKGGKKWAECVPKRRNGDMCHRHWQCLGGWCKEGNKCGGWGCCKDLKKLGEECHAQFGDRCLSRNCGPDNVCVPCEGRECA